jgi:Tripartite ATP-independent periplasmic transporter, DctM component
MQGYISSPLMYMILVNILLLIVGRLMTTGEAILVLAPLLAPLAESYGHRAGRAARAGRRAFLAGRHVSAGGQQRGRLKAQVELQPAVEGATGAASLQDAVSRDPGGRLLASRGGPGIPAPGTPVGRAGPPA